MSREKRPLDSARDGLPNEKRQRPALASVIVEALKMDSLQKLCSTLEPLLRRVVGEEVERALAKLAPSMKGGLTYKSSPKRIQGADTRALRLQFRNKLALPLFTGSKVEGEQGSAIHVVLQDANTGQVVTTGAEAGAKLDIVVLEGDFSADDEEDWSMEDFDTYVVREREGKRPLLTGDLSVTLKEGVGTLGELTFTDNSSWIRSRKFRLGVRVSPGSFEGPRIREGKTDSFSVKDHRGELYKKHYPPALGDDVWRLDKIGKDGAFHKRLNKAGIFSVEDFLRLVVMDPQKLRNVSNEFFSLSFSLFLSAHVVGLAQILGSGMSNKMWEGTVEHAKTCVLSGKLYVYYADEKQNIGVIFNNIFQLMGLMAGGQYLSVDSLSDAEKVYVDKLVKVAYENWESVVEYDGEALIGSMPHSLRGIDAHTEEPAKGNRGSSTLQQQQGFPGSQEFGLVPRGTALTNGGSQPSYAPVSSPVESYSSQQQQHQQQQQQQQQQQHQQQRNQNAMSTGLSLQQSMPSGSGLAYSPQVNPNPSYLQQAPTATAEWLHRQTTQNDEFYSEEEIRAKSLELLESEDMNLQMQQLLRMFNVATNDQASSMPNMNLQDYFPVESVPSSPEKKGSKVGWLKLKAALRWGIFVRKRAAARRRAQIEEIEEE
ncbi:calmodulin-binding protein 60 D isoform X2 [Selaginella moellendorffii]|uniref:calmodulin-binding protein 60 D isoform X2 n=1 Tax=Selaginella moellendorffii TaxID=88036 RepID=UPI000D1C70CB|nr:calmodulin-binding protein 60 D isoform X2 [Selaginella moellendorffii]|eukprot:XP_024522578.1 calmodulin-binding protein 60 D isoform X2 [Selaginella moellendorffii]